MAARTKQARKAASAAAATTSPWVQRLAEDEELRDNFRVAFEAAKDAYERISDGKSPRDLVDDKKLQKDLKQAAGALKDAGSALKDGPKKRSRKRGGLGRKLLVLAIGAAVALALSEDLRGKVLDLLFGKEEEFDYGSTAPAATGDGGGS
jgi:SspJ family small acid-soluble spore protein